MSTKGLIQQEAIQIANAIKSNAYALRPELEKIEARKAEIEARLHSADICHKRLSNFQSEIGRDFQCPRCWISNETRSSLSPIPGTEKEDFFKCKTCGYEISIPF